MWRQFDSQTLIAISFDRAGNVPMSHCALSFITWPTNKKKKKKEREPQYKLKAFFCVGYKKWIIKIHLVFNHKSWFKNKLCVCMTDCMFCLCLYFISARRFFALDINSVVKQSLNYSIMWETEIISLHFLLLQCFNLPKNLVRKNMNFACMFATSDFYPKFIFRIIFISFIIQSVCLQVIFFFSSTGQ